MDNECSLEWEGSLMGGILVGGRALLRRDGLVEREYSLEREGSFDIECSFG